MKKLLLLAGLLVVAASAFAKVETEATTEEIGVYAEVLESLKVERVRDVEFGILERNVTKSEPVQNGEFTISGSKGSKVELSVIDTNAIGVTQDHTYKKIDGTPIPIDLILTGVNMDNIKNNFDKKKMTSYLNVYDESSSIITGDVALDNLNDPYTNGTDKTQVNTFYIKGSLKPSAEQYSGKYKGGLKVKVIHKGWLNTDTSNQ